MRKQVDATATTIMLLLCVTWGLQQTAIKAVSGEMSPLFQIAFRSGGSAALVWLVSHFLFRDQWLRGVAWRSGLVVAILFSAEFLLVAEGLRWTTASHMAMFLYTSPLFAAVGLHLARPEERLNLWQWLGVLVAFGGVVLTLSAPPESTAVSPASPNLLLGDFMGLCAGAAWGLTTVVLRTSRLNDAPPAQTLYYQLAGAFLLSAFVVVVTGKTAITVTPLLVVSLSFQTIVVAFISYLVWFWLLRNYLASRLGVLSLMTPLFGIAFGAILLSEPLTWAFLAGGSFVLGGLVLVSRGKRWGRIAACEEPLAPQPAVESSVCER
ncbi:DMT family transporter [Blastopirellula marina]|uniref:EamA family transporter n=1 Tax=Blastopirellula marina TaxID=124 RepID=A0A2S8FLR7_9BACT|nr:DMT family transporter [Blastopirellula marina]PQO33129.1 EamA family transporter [Blastopirellula marina]PTL43296.1 EamA/RhaT family transporter [Blastopirellula marina]